MSSGAFAYYRWLVFVQPDGGGDARIFLTIHTRENALVCYTRRPSPCTYYGRRNRFDESVSFSVLRTSYDATIVALHSPPPPARTLTDRPVDPERATTPWSTNNGFVVGTSYNLPPPSLKPLARTFGRENRRKRLR